MTLSVRPGIEVRSLQRRNMTILLTGPLKMTIVRIQDSLKLITQTPEPSIPPPSSDVRDILAYIIDGGGTWMQPPTMRHQSFVIPTPRSSVIYPPHVEKTEGYETLLSTMHRFLRGQFALPLPSSQQFRGKLCMTLIWEGSSTTSLGHVHGLSMLIDSH